MMKLLAGSYFFLLPYFVFSQSWQQEPDFPGLERDDAIAVTVQNKAYYGLGFAVGFTCMNDWWSFEKTTGWQQKTSFPGIPRQYAAATASGKYVYIFGGIDQNINHLNDLWRYDTENDSWEELDSLPSVGRQAPICIAVYDKLLIGLGRNSTIYFNDCWLYDPATKEYTSIASLPGGSRYYPIYTSAGGNPIVAHGKGATDCHNDGFYYSSGDMEWIPIDYSPHNGCNYVASASHGFTVFLGGGLDENANFLNNYYEYNLRSNQWNTLPDLPSLPRKGCSMFILNGVLYLIGGIDSNFVRLKEIWTYDFIEVEAAEMEISPNPTSDWLNIYLDESMRGNCEETFVVTLHDMTGKTIIRNEENRNGLGLWFWLDVSDVKSGIYVVSIENCAGLKSEKVVVE